MIYPILAYKDNDDLNLYAFKEEKILKHTSRQILSSGVFNDVTIIDSSGIQYRLKNAREVGWANAIWGISLMRKGRQIMIDFDLDLISKKSLDELKEFVLNRLKQSKRDSLNYELNESVKKAETIEQIINCFV